MQLPQGLLILKRQCLVLIAEACNEVKNGETAAWIWWNGDFFLIL